MKLPQIIKNFQRNLAGIAFPDVCICCGSETVEREKYICSFCLAERFEDANPENKQSSSGVILPDKVIFQHALWQYNKGGDLQRLLHGLKYDRLISIGRQLGRALARRVQQHEPIQKELNENDPLLLPVPLHYLKFRKRGFNQAFYIARGIKDVLGYKVCNIDVVQRKKYTLSQTGFTLERRIKNMEDAFRVARPQYIAGKMVIIVDDVFTTGSTSFELSKTLKEAGARNMMIWTAAQA